ncbi:heparinase II/III domain-containing protein [Bacillus sp. EB01]|uniref:heparinase II/III domain-containing protein n=1 Tax=Bacillus sp. EB01 TaxID=1347086 RepID=UPI0012DFAE57|nr:heparinase II/III family protein [Bacillus sp. EB01]
MDTNWFIETVRPHPRVLFNEGEISEIKSRLNANGTGSTIRFDEIWSSVELLAEEYFSEREFSVHYPSCNVVLDIPLPLVQLEPVGDPPGYIDFPFWTMYSRAIEERIKVLSFAYGMTGEERFALKVKEYLLSITKFAKWFEFGDRGAEGNLSIAHFTIGMAIGYDAIFTTLTNEEKQIIEHTIFQRGLKPLEIDFLNFDSHNIIASKRVAMMIGSLAILDDSNHDEINPFLTNSFGYISRYLDNRLSDPEIEGLLYLNVAARHILLAADILKRSTGNDELIKHDYFRHLPDLFIYLLGTGNKPGFVNFSDSFYDLDLYYLMSVLASNTGNRLSSWYIHRYFEPKFDILIDLKKVPAPVEPESFYKGRPSKVFPLIGWAAFRSGWKQGDHFLAFSSSQSAKDHNHYDQNNFILHAAGEWLITNPGYQDYVEGPRREFTLGTIGHNSMLVDGRGQIQRGGGNLTEWFTSKDFSCVIGEAGDAYDKGIMQWERKIIHLDRRYFLIVDRAVKKKKDSRLSFLYHTPAAIQAGGKELHPRDETSENTIRFIGEQAAVALTICYPPDTAKTISQYPGAERYGSCLEVSVNGSNEVDYQVVLIQPEDVHGADGNRLTCRVIHSGAMFELKVEDASQSLIDYMLTNEDRSTAYQSSRDKIVELMGEQGWVSLRQGDAEPLKYTLINGNQLLVNKTAVFHASGIVCVSVHFHEAGATGTVEAKQRTKVSFLISEPSRVIINGAVAEANQFVFLPETGELVLDLPEGRSEIEIIR